jgi:hypothetical protein
LHYDQVREKFLSLRKDAKVEVVSEAQEVFVGFLLPFW